MKYFEFHVDEIRSAQTQIESLERWRELLVSTMINKCNSVEDMQELYNRLPDCIDKVMLGDQIRQTKKMQGQ